MRHDAPGAIADRVGEIVDSLPEITLAEIDARRSPHAIPISGWRRFTGALASILGGVVLVVVLGWIGWQLIQLGDRTLERAIGPPMESAAVETASVEPTPAPTPAPAPLVLTWVTHGTLDGLPPGDVKALAIGPDGSIWSAVQSFGAIRVAVFAGGAWSVLDSGLDAFDGVPRWLTVTADGFAWMAIVRDDGSERLVGFDGEVWTPAIDLDLWGSVAVEGDGGQLWVAALDSRSRPTRLERARGRWGVARADADLALDVSESARDVEPTAPGMRIAIGDDGVAWYAGNQVVVKFDGRRTVVIGSVADSWVAIDPWGHAWIPTETGLRRYREGAWTYYDARHGLPGTTPLGGSIRFSPTQVWAAFSSDTGLSGYMFDGSGWTESSSMPAGSGLGVVPSHAPRVAYTSEMAGGSAEGDTVWLRSEQDWVPLLGPDGRPFGEVVSLCRAPGGMIWIAANGRLQSVNLDQ